MGVHFCNAHTDCNCLEEMDADQVENGLQFLGITDSPEQTACLARLYPGLPSTRNLKSKLWTLLSWKYNRISLFGAILTLVFPHPVPTEKCEMEPKPPQRFSILGESSCQLFLSPDWLPTALTLRIAKRKYSPRFYTLLTEYFC